MLPAHSPPQITRPLTLAVVLFLVLDLSVLAINFWIAREVDRDAVAINLAGRQRMLTQRVTKSLLLLVESRSGVTYRAALDELADSDRLFDQTMNAFLRGGEATGGDGRMVQLAPLADPRALQLALQAERLWQPLDTEIHRILTQRATQADPLDATVRLASGINLSLLDAANGLTSHMENASLEKTRNLRLVQTAAFLFALTNFLVIVSMLMRRYRQACDQGSVLRELIDQIGAGVCVIENGRIVTANRAAQRLLQRNAAQLKGLRLDAMLHSQGEERVCTLPDGQSLALEIIPGRLATVTGEMSIVTLIDVTERLMERERLSHLAEMDLLTDLPNRRGFMNALERSLAGSRRTDYAVAVAVIDLDGFKAINDSQGHEAGDIVLRAIGLQLKQAARPGDLIARLGGDEFVCLFEGAVAQDRDAIAQRLLAQITTPVEHAHATLSVGASIGFALYPHDAQDAATLLRLADQAMYAAKQSGGNTWR